LYKLFEVLVQNHISIDDIRAEFAIAQLTGRGRVECAKRLFRDLVHLGEFFAQAFLWP
jgi:hypothetical protein